MAATQERIDVVRSMVQQRYTTAAIARALGALRGGVPLGSASAVALSAPALGCQPKRVEKFKKKHGITTYVRLPDAELDALVEWFLAESPAVGPEDGYRQVAAALRADGYNVGEKSLRRSLLRVDPASVEDRRNWMNYRIPRRVKTTYKYHMQVWSVDLNLKLFNHLGVYFAGCVDACSKVIIYLEPHTNKLATTILPFFLKAG